MRQGLSPSPDRNRSNLIFHVSLWFNGSKEKTSILPSFASWTAAEAVAAAAEFAVLEEKDMTMPERLLISPARPIAEEIAPAGWIVTIGITTPPEFVVPVMVMRTGPLGP